MPYRVLLYYPTINIPNDDWLRTAILYSDKVGTIVPTFFDENDLSDEMRFLYDEGLYNPYPALSMSTTTENYKLFEKNFFNKIDSQEFAKISKNWNSNNAFHVFLDKLSPSVKEFLQDKGLLKRSSDYQVLVEEKCSVIYFAMLSSLIAELSPDWVTPSTNIYEYQDLGFGLSDQKRITHQLVFQNCLLTPRHDCDLKKVVRFRKKHIGELLNFREQVSGLEQAILQCETEEERKYELLKFKERLRAAILEMEKMYKHSNLEFVVKSCDSLLKFVSDNLDKGLAVGICASFPFGATVGAGLGGLFLVGKLVAQSNKAQREIDKNAFSYVYYAAKEKYIEPFNI